MTIIRRLTLALGVIEASGLLVVLALLLLESLQSSDSLGRAIGLGLAKLLAIPLVTCVLPGLGLALANRFVPVALALILLSVPLTVVVWRHA